MNKEQEKKIKDLIVKYNDILLVSMRLAIAEDFVNLMIVNRDDSDFVLKDLFNDKEEFNKLILKEFLKKNRTSVTQELKYMKSTLPDFQNILKNAVNPYGISGASEKILEVIKSIELPGLLKKKFNKLDSSCG